MSIFKGFTEDISKKLDGEREVKKFALGGDREERYKKLLDMYLGYIKNLSNNDLDMMIKEKELILINLLLKK